MARCEKYDYEAFVALLLLAFSAKPDMSLTEFFDAIGLANTRHLKRYGRPIIDLPHHDVDELSVSEVEVFMEVLGAE